LLEELEEEAEWTEQTDSRAAGSLDAGDTEVEEEEAKLVGGRRKRSCRVGWSAIPLKRPRARMSPKCRRESI
jgi:hypothetical protein